MHAIKRAPRKCIFCSFQSHYGSLFLRRPRSSSSTKEVVGQRPIPIESTSSSPQPDHYDPRKPDTKPKTGKVKLEISRRFNPENTIRSLLNELQSIIANAPSVPGLDLTPNQVRYKYKIFKRQLLEQSAGQKTETAKLWRRLIHVCKNEPGQVLMVELRAAFHGFLLAEKQRQLGIQDHLYDLCNFEYPYEWYPATRGIQRELHLHVGPTNSGKTYHALKRLEQAQSGIYAGPLRLLAHEVYTRLNARGFRCNLITGDDRRTADDDPSAPMSSCTVEMVPLNSSVDVAVIDEIQMLGSDDRGWAWTQAVLGLKARELHMCGEERSIPIVQRLAALCGEQLHIHRYQRLTPLALMPASLGGNLKGLRKGDCVVSFSIQAIHALRQAIERTLNVRCAVIYGSLPAEVRVQQADLFNDPTNDYDILVASNAVGMGLNLKIKRMIFQTSQVYIDGKFVRVPIAEVKQIAGRAGRYSAPATDGRPAVAAPSSTIQKPADAPKSVGWVTTLENMDYAYLREAMTQDAEPITSAGLLPPALAIERFAKLYPPGTPLAFILLQVQQYTATKTCFHMCDMSQYLLVADALESIPNLTVLERLIFCAVPMDMKKPGEPILLRAFARAVAENRCVTILDIPELELELLDSTDQYSREYLQKIEALHKGVVAFLWLSYRFKASLMDQGLAIHVKELVQQKIQDVLAKLSFNWEAMRQARERAFRKVLQQQREYDRSIYGDDTTATGGTSSILTPSGEESESSEGASSSDLVSEVNENSEDLEEVAKEDELLAEKADENPIYSVPLASSDGIQDGDDSVTPSSSTTVEKSKKATATG